LLTSTASITTKSSSKNKWSPALVTLALLSLVGGLGYFAWTHGLATVFQQSFTHHHYRSSTNTIGDAAMEPTMALISTDANALDPKDDAANSPSQVKIRSQHVRLGPFDADEL
jgi:cytoskeletal protein RodZ